MHETNMDTNKQESVADLKEKLLSLLLELASVYYKNKNGDYEDNLKRTVYCYREALSLIDKCQSVEKWAECCLSLCKTLLRLRQGALEAACQAITYGKMGLEAIGRTDFPELWHSIHLYLAIAYRRMGTTADTEIGEHHYQVAFDFKDKPKLTSALKRIDSLFREMDNIRAILKDDTCDS
jgi:hypothetical protein